MTDQANHLSSNQEAKVKRKSQRIENPIDFFSDWAYCVDKHHYPLLGMEFREFVVKKTPIRSWAIWNPISTDIPEGTVFYSKANPDNFLQVLSDWDAFRVEVHTGHMHTDHQRSAWAVKHSALADWLRTGLRPTAALMIDQSNSKAGVLAWHISRSTTQQTES